MDPRDQLGDFIANFYSFFIDPLFDILKSTDILGFSLFNWVFGFTVTSLAIRFLRHFFGSDDKD